MSLLITSTPHRVTIRHWTSTGEDDRGNKTGSYTDITNVPALMRETSETEEPTGEETIVVS